MTTSSSCPTHTLSFATTPSATELAHYCKAVWMGQVAMQLVIAAQKLEKKKKEKKSTMLESML